MTRYITKRIVYAIVSLFVLITLLFFLLQTLPGYPIIQGDKQTDAAYQAELQAAGLLDNPVVQYFKFLGGFFSTGQFGVIFSSSISTYEALLDPIGYSMWVALPAFVLSSIIGILLGTAAAYKRGTILDTLINIFVVMFNAVPSFVLAIYFIQLAGHWNLPFNFIIPNDDLSNIGQTIQSIIVPVLAMTLTSLTSITIYTRNELVEIFKQDYVKTALSKGVSFSAVLFRHSTRNAGIPVLSILIPSLLTVITGSIIIEQFFNIPGAGSIMIDMLNAKQFYAVLFSAFFYSGIAFGLQIIMDVLYSVVDPRIVLAEKNAASLVDKIKNAGIRKFNEEGGIAKWARA